MAEPQIRFEDGAGYERMMGRWSRLAGEIFLDWLQPAAGLGWLDDGCGSGALAQLIADRCGPAEIAGLDLSEGQLAYARTRPAARIAEFRQGDAMALPFADSSFDAAAMALVIFFLSDPAKGVAEMARVVRPGGLVAAYAWDLLGGGFPLQPIYAELPSFGMVPLLPPSAEASRIERLRELWTGAGLEAVETREISVKRTFADFADFWTTSLLGTTLRMKLADMSPADLERLRERVHTSVPAEPDGRITCSARANAVKGRVGALRGSGPDIRCGSRLAEFSTHPKP